MKMNIVVGSDHITVDVNEKKIVWMQRTGASLSWAGTITDSLASIFNEYALENFTFAKSPDGGYDIKSVLKKK